jgi:hypothetical protein
MNSIKIILESVEEQKFQTAKKDAKKASDDANSYKESDSEYIGAHRLAETANNLAAFHAKKLGKDKEHQLYSKIAKEHFTKQKSAGKNKWSTPGVNVSS